MTQDMKKDMILHTIGKRLVRNVRTLCPSRANSQYVLSGLRNLNNKDITARRSRDYGTYLTTLRFVVPLLMVLTLGATTAWGQTDYSGVWYIASGGNTKESGGYTYSSSTPASNFYLVPTCGPAVAANKSDVFHDNTGEQEPFLTTCKIGQDNEAVWVLKQVTDDDGTFYYVIHVKTNKYVVYDPYFTGYSDPSTDGNWRRKCMHLQSSSDENAKFVVGERDEANYFIPKVFKDKTPGKKTPYIFWNISDGNKNNRQGQGASNYWNGLVGLYGLDNNSLVLDPNSRWQFETAHLAAPTISDVSASNTITITDANSLPAGYTIRYTTGDGTQNAPTATTGTEYSGAIDVTSSMTVKAVVVRYGIVLTNVASKAVSPAVESPTVTNNFDGTISLNTATPGATIYYTTNGDTPDNNSTQYVNTPFSLGNATVIKAIAYLGSVSSVVTTYNVPQYTTPTISFNDATSQITINGLTGATIYYTTDGSTPTASNYTGTGTTTVTINNVSSATTVKAIATHAGYLASDVETLAIAQVATPTIQSDGNNGISITCATEGATIYYTTDGSTPTTSSTEYTGSLTENVSGVTIKVIAVKENMIPSAVGSGTVTLACSNPTFARIGKTVAISCSFPTSGVTIRYTIGGVDPGNSSNVYSGVVDVSSETLPITVKAYASAAGYLDSEIATYTITSFGSGTAEDPYTIASSQEFKEFISNVNADSGNAAAYYQIKGDIDASGSSAITRAFTGTLEGTAKADGTFYTISNLDHALFNTINGGTVKNVILDDVSVSGSGNVGAIANEATGDSRIYNCGILSGSVGGQDYVGGLVGLLDGSSRVINCFSYADITSGSVKAGIVGYNNVATVYTNIQTMVMNCMFYGDIDDNSGSVYPIYGGTEISNDYNNGTSKRLNNYNYFLYEAPFSVGNHITQYNSALAAEGRFLVRFEFYRHLLNSTRELAAWYATGNANNGKGVGAANKMAKWVLDKSIAPYPILKVQDTYPSVVNYAPSEVMIDADNEHRNEGRKLGTLTVNISIGSGYPTGAAIKTGKSQITLTRTDKDPDNYNFNYDKIQLPYYNEVGTGNCTHNKAVTGWKITSMTNGTQGTFTASDTWDGYNFADRAHYAKDLNGTSGRVFSQGGYFNVPEGVTAINIEPYWANAVYLSDACYDRYGYGATDDLTQVGGGQRYTGGNTYSINGDNQVVYTTIANALGGLSNASSVYDNAVVLVGNYHHSDGIGGGAGNELASNKDKAFTIMSIDLNEDNEPDYSLIFRSGKQKTVSPIRYDFINVPAMAMAHKMATHGDLAIPGNCKPLGWFEITTTALMRFNQFEYDSESKKIEAPIILMGGVIEQFVSTNGNPPNPWRTNYLLFGDNVWFKVCSNGCHMEKTYGTPHIPISVTGGDYEEFYLSGFFAPKAVAADDNAEGYIDGGRFGEVAGGGQEEIKGNVTWLIDHADIENFYAGGINAAKSIKGDISTTIKNSHVGVFCGGPKFGDMASGKTIGVTANNCTFGTYFGAGFGGTSSYKDQVYNVYQKLNYNEWNTKLTSNYKSNTRGYYKVDASKDIDGILYDYEYELFGGSTGNVHRLYMLYASFSKAQTNNASSTLTGCTVTGNFYGAGSLGAVVGDVTSTLNNTQVLGSAFGAGYSVTIPKVDVRNLGSFDPEPSYNETTAVYVKAGFPGTTQYEWTTVESLSSDDNALNDTDHTIKTKLPTTGLGSVTGNVTLTIKGYSEVGGNVFGGGESSSVIGAGNKVTVNIEGNTQILGNVFGGGDKGVVEGSTQVNIGEIPTSSSGSGSGSGGESGGGSGN